MLNYCINNQKFSPRNRITFLECRSVNEMKCFVSGEKFDYKGRNVLDRCASMLMGLL